MKLKLNIIHGYKIFFIIFVLSLQLGLINNMNNNNFIEAIKNFEQEHLEIFKTSTNNEKILRFLEDENENQHPTNFLNSEKEYQSYNCKIRPNQNFGQPFGLFPELLGKLKNKEDVILRSLYK